MESIDTSVTDLVQARIRGAEPQFFGGGGFSVNHVFISYVSENWEIVQRLCDELTEHGVKVWHDRKDIAVGDRWKQKIREAIRAGDFFLACFSKESNNRKKTFMNDEVALAIEELKQYPNDRAWFLPVLLSECDVPACSIGGNETLLDIEWVSLYADWDAGIQRIVGVIKPIPKEFQIAFEALETGDTKLRRHAAEELAEFRDHRAVHALTNVLDLGDDSIRSAAAAAMLKLGKVPAIWDPSSISRLLKALGDDDVWVGMYASLALGNIGRAAVRGLMEALESRSVDDKSTRLCINALCALRASTTVSALRELLEDENLNARTVSALRELLENQNLNVVRYATEALGKIGESAKSAVPELRVLLRNNNISLRENAAEALEKIGTPEAMEAVEDYNNKNREKELKELDKEDRDRP